MEARLYWSSTREYSLKFIRYLVYYAPYQAANGSSFKVVLPSLLPQIFAEICMKAASRGISGFTEILFPADFATMSMSKLKTISYKAAQAGREVCIYRLPKPIALFEMAVIEGDTPIMAFFRLFDNL